MPDKTYAKFILNNETYLDLTGDTVDSSSLLSGYTAHDRSGALITGSFDTSIFVLKAGDTMSGSLTIANIEAEQLFEINSKNGLRLALDLSSLCNQGIWSSGYANSLTADGAYIADSSWIIVRDSSNRVKVPKWASRGSNSSPVYFDEDGQPQASSYSFSNYLLKSGGTMTGDLTISKTTSSVGNIAECRVILGNSRDQSAQTGSSLGVLRLYGNRTGYVELRAKNGSTTNNTISFPDSNGTVALTSDLSSYVAKSGSTMTGALTLSGAPTENLHAATKKYVDDSVANYLPLTGGIMGKTVEDPNDDTHTHVYTNSVFPDYIAMVDTEYQSSSIINQTLNAITSSGIGFSKLYTGTGVPFTSEATLNDQALTFTATPDGGAQSTYASYKKDGISYTTYNYVFPSKSGTFALTNDLLSYISKTGGTITGGYLIIEDTHLTSGSSSAYLTLGNNVDSSSEGSSFGALNLYGTGTYKSDIRTTTLTDNRQLYLPDKDGTLAVTDDLNSYVLKSGDSLTGALSFYDGNTLKSKISNTELQINGVNMLKYINGLTISFATAIPANVNLNTETYSLVGEYYCSSNVTAQSQTNCPTQYSYKITVENPTNSTIELSGNWQSRNRYLTDAVGAKWIQNIQINGSGVATWGVWKPFISGYIAGNLQVNASGASFDEAYCKQYGKTVNVRAWITGLSTSTQTHTNVITVQLVDMPTTAVRFVFTCWLGNGIAAYAGYGVMDTSGRITLVKAVANSDKASFEFTYNV